MDLIAIPIRNQNLPTKFFILLIAVNLVNLLLFNESQVTWILCLIPETESSALLLRSTFFNVGNLVNSAEINN